MDDFQRELARIRTAIRKQLQTCIKCKRPWPADPDEQARWGVNAPLGYPIQVICPDCVTPEQVAEGVIREATEVIDWDAKGRIVRQPKVFDDDDEAR